MSDIVQRVFEHLSAAMGCEPANLSERRGQMEYARVIVATVKDDGQAALIAAARDRRVQPERASSDTFIPKLVDGELGWVEHTPSVEAAEVKDSGERCQCCGCSYLTVWWAGDRDNGALWSQVYEQATGQQRDEAGLLCPTCFDDAARKLGITLGWVAIPYWARVTELEQARERVQELEKERVKSIKRETCLRKALVKARSVVDSTREEACLLGHSDWLEFYNNVLKDIDVALKSEDSKS